MSTALRDWRRISALFDELAPLAPADRVEHLAGLDIDDDAARWLRCMLEAADRDESSVLDATLDEIVGALAVESGEPVGSIPDDLTGMRVGNWRLGDEIGRGAMAAVFEGERADGAYQHRVAIKVLQPGLFSDAERRRMRNELGLLAGLEHPGIARLIDGGVSGDGWPFLVMEYVEGSHIDEWLDRHGASTEQRLKLLIRVAGAVAYAHGQLVVHADIKPSNVLVNPQGEPKLVDFGIACWLNASDDPAAAGSELLLRCSPAYAAPEQIAGERPTVAQDVFGLGALAYELLTGKRIREAAGVTRLLAGRSDSDYAARPSASGPGPVPRKRLRGDLDAIVARALADDPNARYPSAEAFADDLRRHLRHEPVGARPATPGYRLGRWMRRNRLIAGAAATVALGLGAAAIFSAWQADRAREQAARAEAVTGFVLDIFDAADPFANRQQPLTVNQLVARQAERIDALSQGRPELRRELRRTLARVQGNLGNHDQSLALYRRALNNDRGVAPAERARLHLGVAAQARALGRFELALRHARTARDLAPLASATAPVAVAAVREHATVLTEMRRNREAAELLERALGHRESIARLPDGEALIGNLLADLSERVGTAGDTERALALLDEALALYGRAYDRAHPEVANAYARRATTLRAAGDFRGAVRASFNAALQSRERLGLEHSQSIRHDSALAVDLAYLDCHAEALSLHAEIIGRYRAIYGPDNVLTAGALMNQASMRRKVGQYETALAEVDRALSVFARQPEPPGDMRAFALGIRAQLLFALGRQVEAASDSREALAAMRAATGERHPRALRIQVGHGDLLLRIGRARDAVRHLEDAHAALSETLGPDSAHTRDAAGKLAAALRSAGRDAEAALLAGNARGVDAAESASGPEPGPVSEGRKCRLPSTIALERLGVSI